MNQPVVEMKDLTVTLKGREILVGVNLSLDSGEFLGVVGPNGSGKTTLLKVILGLITPDQGWVRVFGRPPEEVLKKGNSIGYLPQHPPSNLDFPVSVLDVVLMGRYGKLGLFHWPGDYDRKMALEYLYLVGMADLAHRHFGQLSGGQQQRISIARALVGEPKLLILDEPSTGIDLVAQEDFYQLLARLKRERGITLILVSHDVGVITSFVDQIACLNRSLHYHGKPQGCLEEGVLAKVYPRSFDILVHDPSCLGCRVETRKDD
jgi:zinc transport system ATP-binding protein